MAAAPLTVLVVSAPADGGPLAGDFASAGWMVARAGDVAAASQSARRAPPDVVIARGDVPGGGSLGLLRRLRASAHTALVPVIVVADAADAPREECTRWGAQACLAAGTPGPEVVAAAEAACAETRRAAVRPPPVAPAVALERPARLRALQRTQLLDTPPEALFDRVARLTAQVLEVPVVLMTLVDRHRQFFKAQVGLPEPIASARETPLTHSYCQWVVADQGELVVSDARRHPVLARNPATEDLGLVAYAGIPLRSDSIETIGSFCAVDRKPREWDTRELHALRDAADVIEGLTVLRQSAISPPDTWDEFRVVTGVAGQAVRGAANLLQAHGSQLGADERAGLVELVADLGGRLTEVARDRI